MGGACTRLAVNARKGGACTETVAYSPMIAKQGIKNFLSIGSLLALAIASIIFGAPVLGRPLLSNLGYVQLAHAALHKELGAAPPSAALAESLFNGAISLGDLTAETQLGLAMALEQDGETEQAEQILARLSREQPADYRIQDEQAEILMQVQKEEEALKIWSRIGADTRLFLASQNVMKEGKRELAVHFLQAAVRVNPKNSFAYRDLGEAFFSIEHNLDGAAEYLKRAIELNPTDPYNYLLTSSIYLQGGKSDEALNWAKMMISKFPQDARGYAEEGSILDAKKQSFEMLVAFQRAESLDAGNPDYAAEVGVGYLRLGDFALAREKLEYATRLRDGVAWYHSHLGAAYAGLEMRDQAIHEFERALELESNDPWSRDSLARLRQEP